MRKGAEDYNPDALCGRPVNMAMARSIGDAFEAIYQDIAGDVVFPMVSEVFREFNSQFLQAKSAGFTPQEAQAIAIGENVLIPGLADDFPADSALTTPPLTTENREVSYVLVPDDFVGDLGDFSEIPVESEQFQFSTDDAEEAFAEMEAEAAKSRSPPDNPIAPPDNPENLESEDEDEGNLPFHEINDSELRDYIREQRNPNTERKTRQVQKKKPPKTPKIPRVEPPFQVSCHSRRGGNCNS